MTIEKIDLVSVKRVSGAFTKPEVGKIVALMEVIGCVIAVKTRNTDAGETTRFVGDFIAKNDATGALFQATDLMLPTFAADMLTDAGAGAEGKIVSFGMKLEAKTDAKGRPQFSAEFTIEPTEATLAAGVVKEHAPEWLTEASAPAPATQEAPKAKKK